MCLFSFVCTGVELPLCMHCMGRGTGFGQESAQHRIADYHARDAAAVWLILACQSVAALPDATVLEEACVRETWPSLPLSPMPV